MDFAEIFSRKLKSWGISGKSLAAASGRSVSNISEIRNGVVAPSITDFQELVRICDRLKPGFAADYYASLSPIDFSPEQLIRRLDTSQLASLMYAVGQRIQDYGQSQRKEVIAS
jgi:transcriptional regulator with XRE-family HTH domain